MPLVQLPDTSKLSQLELTNPKPLMRERIGMVMYLRMMGLTNLSSSSGCGSPGAASRLSARTKLQNSYDWTMQIGWSAFPAPCH